MTLFRNITAGAILWSLIFLSFTIMEFIPTLKEATELQNGIILLLLVPFLLLSLKYFYRREDRSHGLRFGLVTIITSLSLDALITVPLVIMPKGGSYRTFFTDPGLVVMGMVIFLVSFLYWRFRIKEKQTINDRRDFNISL